MKSKKNSSHSSENSIIEDWIEKNTKHKNKEFNNFQSEISYKDYESSLNPFDPEKMISTDDIFNSKGEQFLYYNPPSSKVQDNLNTLLGKKREKQSNDDNIKNKKSKRNWNIKKQIKRNLIQEHFLDWGNKNIKKPELKLKKIDPKLLKDKYNNLSNILDVTLAEIYSNDICKKDIRKNITKKHNINIICNLTKNCILYSKMKLSFRDVLKMFFKMPLDSKIFDNSLKEGLIDYKEYYDSRKTNNYTYNKKLVENLVKICDLIFNESEKSTGPNSKHLYD